jgi:hypothetical protein
LSSFRSRKRNAWRGIIGLTAASLISDNKPSPSAQDTTTLLALHSASEGNYYRHQCSKHRHGIEPPARNQGFYDWRLSGGDGSLVGEEATTSMRRF